MVLQNIKSGFLKRLSTANNLLQYEFVGKGKRGTPLIIKTVLSVCSFSIWINESLPDSSEYINQSWKQHIFFSGATDSVSVRNQNLRRNRSMETGRAKIVRNGKAENTCKEVLFATELTWATPTRKSGMAVFQSTCTLYQGYFYIPSGIGKLQLVIILLIRIGLQSPGFMPSIQVINILAGATYYTVGVLKNRQGKNNRISSSSFGYSHSSNFEKIRLIVLHFSTDDALWRSRQEDVRGFGGLILGNRHSTGRLHLRIHHQCCIGFPR